MFHKHLCGGEVLNIEEYRVIITKARETFGYDVLSDERVNSLWTKVRELDVQVFGSLWLQSLYDRKDDQMFSKLEQAVDFALSKIKHAFKAPISQLENKEEVSKTTVRCNLCADKGLVFAKEGGYEFVFKCSCNYGRAFEQNLPQWNVSLEYRYKPSYKGSAL